MLSHLAIFLLYKKIYIIIKIRIFNTLGGKALKLFKKNYPLANLLKLF